jgi:hypothetical protein
MSKLPQFRYSSSHTHDEQIASLMTAYPGTQERPPYGMFHLTFNNRKMQGRFGYRSEECMGTLYPTGHVHLDTMAFPRISFDTFDEMKEALEEWGDVWIRFEVAP